MQTVLQVVSLSHRYGDTLALSRISLQLGRGEGVALLGPNGAGKSTLMKAIMGAIRPQEGEIRLFNKPLNKQRGVLGYVPQEIALQEDLSVKENLEILGACAGLRGDRFRRGVSEGIALAGLEQRAHERVDRLSGGMKRRLNLAAGLIHNPPLLLLDEPTAGIDPLETSRILRALKAWKAKGGSFLLSTHRMEEVEGLCDRVIFLHEGVLLEEGTVSEVLSRCQTKAAIHVLFSSTPPPIPSGWPRDLSVEVRKDRWVVSTSGSEGLATVASLVGGVQDLTGLEPHRPDLGVRFRELAGTGLVPS